MIPTDNGELINRVIELEEKSAEDKKTITELKRKLELSQCSYNLLLGSEI